MTARLPGFYEEQRQRVEEALEEWLPASEDEPQILTEAVRYSVLNGGKRLRGVLVLEAGRLAGRDDEVTAGLAALIEMIHAYSLVHDDLPAMDDDDYRRGKPANHKKFGEDIAILAGDALLTRAFYVLGHLSAPGEELPVARLLEVLTEHIGVQGLIGGQILDITAADREADLEQLKAIHRWKTGALITVSLLLGGIAGGANEELLKGLRRFGELIGHAFQIKDDLLDVTADFEKLGKEPGADERAGKLTYPALLGVEKSQQRARQLIEEACRMLDEVTTAGGRLNELARFVISREK